MAKVLRTSVVWLTTLFAVLSSAGRLHSQEADKNADRLTLLDGSSVVGRITSIESSGRLSVDGVVSPFHISALRLIQRPTRAAAYANGKTAAESVVIDLVGGGRILAKTLTIADERCQISWKFGDQFTVPLDSVRAIRFENKIAPEFQKAIADDASDFDQLFAKVDGKLVLIQAFIEELDEQKLVFEWKSEQQSVPRASLHGIVVALVGDKPDHAGQCRVELDNGSTIWGRIESLVAAEGSGSTPAKLILRVSEDTKVTLPWDSVMRVKVQSDRLVYISRLTPVEVKEQPIVAFPRQWKRNKSVGGCPLRIGQESFETGIGVQARSRLTFDADKKYEFLTATIGIDSETEGRGDCIFMVLGDDKELFKRRVKGTDAPYRLQIEIRGVQQVSLLVEPGEDLDFGDHADWCDVCFVRPAK